MRQETDHPVGRGERGSGFAEDCSRDCASFQSLHARNSCFSHHHIHQQQPEPLSFGKVSIDTCNVLVALRTYAWHPSYVHPLHPQSLKS